VNVSFFRQQNLWVYLLVFLLGITSVFSVQRITRVVTLCHPEYDLVNPQFRCLGLQDRNEWEYEPLRNAVIRKVADLQETKKVTSMSVYFRDLNNGPRFGIHEDQVFFGASLLKVPVMIAILHIANYQHDLLDQKLSYSKPNVNAYTTEQSNDVIKPNTQYTIRELLKAMIADSDNNAAYLLVEKISSSSLPSNSNAFLDLGMARMMSGEMDSLSLQSYANLFAILYNTWYLSDGMSQYALELLSQSTFKQGLVAGVPEDIKVAHKFGIHAFEEEQSELHDCGIIYHPTTPYVLCVMTSGTKIEDEAASIAEISRLVYDGVNTLPGQAD
jgi:beta-lactamase class A